MKLHCTLVLMAVVVAAPVAVASEAGPDPTALATTEAILSYCAKVDPAGAAKIQGQIQLVTHGASDAALAEVRKSEAYKQARATADESLAKVDSHDALTICGQHPAPTG